MANLLIDLTLTSAFTVTGSFSDITDMSQVVSVAGPSSMVILMMSLNPEMVGTDACAEYRFTHDGVQVGPKLACTIDQVDEGSGITLFFALTGLSAGSHTFAVQAQNRENTAVIDTAFERTFQCVEIEAGATFLVDKSSVASDTAPAAYANVVDLSDTQTPGAGSLLLFILGMSQEFGSDETAKYRFAIDGIREGPEMTQFSDSDVEGNSTSMVYGRTGVSAASHVFSVQWERTQVIPVADTARTRIFQVIEFTADADLLIDKSSVSAQDAPAAYADIADMDGSPVIDSTGSIVLVLCNMTQDRGADTTSTRRFDIGGTQEGAEVSSFSDNGASDDMSGLLMARAVTGESGSTAMALQWIQRQAVASTSTAFTRTFQVIDLKLAALGPISASPDLALTAAADLQGIGGISASPDLAITAAADLQGIGGISASPALAFDLAAQLDGLQELSASPAMAFTLTADLSDAAAIPVSTFTSRHIEKFIN